MDVSQARQKLKKLINEQARLVDCFISRIPLVKGTVYPIEVKCGKKGCRCEKEGKRHKAWQISRSHEGKSQTRCIGLGDLPKYKKMARYYRRFRKARERFVKLHKEQIELINVLEVGRRIEDIWERQR